MALLPLHILWQNDPKVFRVVFRLDAEIEIEKKYLFFIFEVFSKKRKGPRNER